ncbi:MAG: GspH/FimT family pseudopilin [Gammaproteobacteria bacterium]|nr:GspH/FimT family pseudopilin [Gammaproteobacteria bacterium]
MKTGPRAIKYSGGFTLVEMMITLVVVAILLSAAVPSFSAMIKSSRLATQTNSIITDIHFARNEAVKRSTTVIMCRSANPDATSPSCGGTQQVWTGGYLIFADDGKKTNTIYDAGTDILLRRSQAAAQDVVIHTNTAWDSNIRFGYSGNADGNGGTAVMSICDDRGTSYGREIKVMPSGSTVASSLTSPSCVL